MSVYTSVRITVWLLSFCVDGTDETEDLELVTTEG